MITSTKLTSGFCAALALVLFSQNSAMGAVTQVIYSGTVGFSINSTGMFGPGSLDGLAYTMIYTIDDSAAGSTLSSTPTMSAISGSGASSPVHLAITINGVTRTINGSQEGKAEQFDIIYSSGQPSNGSADKVRQVSSEYTYVEGDYLHSYSAETWISSYAQDFVHSPDFRQPLTYAGSTGTDSIYNLVQFNDFNYVTNTQVNYASLNLLIGSVQVTPVPEPSIWALATLGATAVFKRRRTNR